MTKIKLWASLCYRRNCQNYARTVERAPITADFTQGSYGRKALGNLLAYHVVMSQWAKVNSLRLVSMGFTSRVDWMSMAVYRVYVLPHREDVCYELIISTLNSRGPNKCWRSGINYTYQMTSTHHHLWVACGQRYSTQYFLHPSFLLPLLLFRWVRQDLCAAISAQWLGDIQQANKNKMTPQKMNIYEKSGIAFDEWLILMLVLPIHYNNLKSSDVNNMSTCVGMFLFHEVLCFMI